MRDLTDKIAENKRDAVIELEKSVLYLKVDGLTVFTIRQDVCFGNDLMIRYWKKLDKTSFKHECV